MIDFCRGEGIHVLDINDESLPDKIRHPNKIMVSIGWDRLLPQEFFPMFDAAINCHGGLLPDYRGKYPYMHNFANIADEYGCTIHYMNEKFDDGNIILQRRHKLFLEETPLLMHRRIAEMKAYSIPEAIRLVEQGYLGEKQRGTARYFYKMDRIEMETLGQRNIENLRAGRPLELSRHKEWQL